MQPEGETVYLLQLQTVLASAPACTPLGTEDVSRVRERASRTKTLSGHGQVEDESTGQERQADLDRSDVSLGGVVGSRGTAHSGAYQREA
jgi:hypothetical protein